MAKPDRDRPIKIVCVVENGLVRVIYSNWPTDEFEVDVIAIDTDEISESDQKLIALCEDSLNEIW